MPTEDKCQPCISRCSPINVHTLGVYTLPDIGPLQISHGTYARIYRTLLPGQRVLQKNASPYLNYP